MDKNYVSVEYEKLEELITAKSKLDAIRELIQKEEYVTDAIRAIRIVLNMEITNVD